MLSHKPIKTSPNTYQSTSEWPSFTQTQSFKAAAFRTSLPWSVVRHTSFESNQHLNAPFSSIISPRRSMCLSKLPFVHPFRPSIHPSFLIPSSIIILPLSSSRSNRRHSLLITLGPWLAHATFLDLVLSGTLSLGSHIGPNLAFTCIRLQWNAGLKDY